MLELTKHYYLHFIDGWKTMIECKADLTFE